MIALSMSDISVIVLTYWMTSGFELTKKLYRRYKTQMGRARACCRHKKLGGGGGGVAKQKKIFLISFFQLIESVLD